MNTYKPFLVLTLTLAFLQPLPALGKWTGTPSSQIVYNGMTEDFVPFNYLENGEVKGMATEVVRETFKRANMKVKLTVWPWARAYNAALKKPKHFVYSTSRTAEREKLFKWVGPIAQDEVFLACLDEAPFKAAADFRDFKKHSTSGQHGDLPIEFLQKNGFKVTIYTDENERMAAFKKGRIELDIVTTGSQKTYEEKWNLKYRKLAFMYATDYWMAFHPDTPQAVIESLNKALESIRKDGTLKKIASKY